MRALHQRLWWMELTRGLIACALGLLFLTARSFAPRLFMYSLGTYLVADGALELIYTYKRKGHSRLKPLDWAGGTLSILAGLLMLAFPTITLFIVAALIAIRLFIKGLSQARAARHARSSNAFLLWASCCFFVSSGFFLLLLPQLAITVLVVFLGSYMLAAGLFLLLRGLSLRFRLGKLPSSPAQLQQTLPVPCDDLSFPTRRAIVFIHRQAADGLGHIAWGFEWMNGWFNVGSVENLKSKPFTDPEDMDFWCAHTLDPVATVQERKYPCDEYKLFSVKQPHPKEAWKTVIWESREPYSFVHHNCCDVTYEILRAYGCVELLDPAKEYIPNDWYDALPGSSYAIADYPAIAVSLHRQSRSTPTVRELALTIPARVQGAQPSPRPYGLRPWEELMLLWEMVIGHLLTLYASATRLVTRYWHSRAPSPSPDAPEPEMLTQKNGEENFHNAAQDSPSY